jgi:hypothetical protein
MGQNALAPVFLSASLPDPRRDPVYFNGADLIGIREAGRALTLVVLPRTRLVFGGHPAITPLIRMAAESIGAVDHVRIFQSELFAERAPKDNAAFPGLVRVRPVRGNREASLLRMRKTMLRSEKFGAGVFIGGMEGVEQEYELFRDLHPHARVLPIASAGGAARLLFNQGAGPQDSRIRKALENDTVFGALFLKLLDLV